MTIDIRAPKTGGGVVTIPSHKVVLPSSKSISNRALVINALAGDWSSVPDNVSECDDTRVMLNWLHGSSETVDIGAAGTAMRFSTALLSVTEGERVITGTERMKNRPIGVLVDALRGLGASIDYLEKEGYPPLRIKGNAGLAGGKLSLPGNISSQYISALLMIGPVLRDGLTLTLTDNIVSRPYIDLTLKLMGEFGAEAGWTAEDVIEVRPKRYVKIPFYVENDWSASSYWYEIAALSDSCELRLPGLFGDSYQGDSAVRKLFRNLGVSSEQVVDEDGMEGIVIRKDRKACDRFDYDFVNQPDLAQTFVVCCCMMNVPFHFRGLQSLKIKETDRITALRAELAKMGYAVGEANDSELYWNGERCEAMPDFAIDTYEDHRMAMAFAPCALKLPHIKINNPQVVSKSYPKYWEDLKSAGFMIETL